MKKSDIKVLVITGFGLNCEKETAAAVKLVGANPDLVHLNDLIAGKKSLKDYQFLIFIGGFSFGDHLGSGTIFANRVKFQLKADLEQFIADGKLILGICNGFQTLTRLGIVPALNGKYFEQQSALAHNDSGLFRDDWCILAANPASPCVFTKNLNAIHLPLRHGEGKFVAEPEILAEIEAKNLVAVRYVNADLTNANEFPANPNGSLNSIAGICDESGRIFGLMPHPEAFLSPFNAPDWGTKKLEGKLPAEGEGVGIFRNAIEYIEKHF